MNDIIVRLAEPFDPGDITWKPGHTTKDGGKCMAMAYADLRAYQERLDAVCGMDWSIRYEAWGERRLMAHLTIAGVTRCSTGEMAEQDIKNGMGGTVAEAQAFKRAAAMFGLGRFLYDLPSVWVEFDAQSKKISKAGQETLDKRYHDWYTRKIKLLNVGVGNEDSEHEPAQEPAPIHANGNGKAATKPATAQKPPAAQDNPFDGESATLDRLVALGVEVYGDEWKDKCKILADKASTGNTNDIGKLTQAERALLVSGMLKKQAVQKQPA